MNTNRNWVLQLLAFAFGQYMVPNEGGGEAAPTPAKPKTEVLNVTMQDGRVVGFAGKRKLIKTATIDGGQVVLQFDFRNGETRKYPLREDMILQFAAHGGEQKYGDETAGVDDVDDMVLATDELHERLYNGGPEAWTIKREAGGMAGTSVLLRALVEHSGKTPEAIKAFLSTKTQAEKQALRQSSKLKPIVERIEAEKAAKASKVDTDALLGELA